MKRKAYSTLALLGALAPSAFSADVTWTGATDNVWDQVTSNWAGDFNTYLDGDNVTFDDSASQFTVDVPATVLPAMVTFDSATGNTYTMVGAGSIGTSATPASLTLTGDVNVVLNGAATNEFGAVSLASGSTVTHQLTGGESRFGDLTGSGGIVVEQNQLVLLGDNSGFTGTMTIDGGILNINSPNALAGTVVINTGGTLLSFNDEYTTSAPVTLNGGRMSLDGGAAGVTFNGLVTLTDSSTIGGGLATVGSVATGGNNITFDNNGTLAVTGTLSGAGDLIKTNVGTLDLTGATNSLTGNTVVNGGNILANATTIASGKTLSGNGGTVTANTVVQAGGALSVGDGQLSGVNQTTVQVTYVDADFATNTTLSDGSAAVENTHFSSTNTADGLWQIRGFANGGNIISSNDAGAEDAPALRTTISGLTPGEEFEVFAFAWGAENNGNWRLRASLTDPAGGEVPDGWNARHFNGSGFSAMTIITRGLGGDNPGPISTDDGAFENGGVFLNGSGVLTREGDRGMAMANLGTAMVDANGNIVVYIDDLANTTQANRTWYDGVGFGSTITLPSFEDNIQTLTVDGDLNLQASSSLQLEVLADNVFDMLVVTGQLTANGSFDLLLGSGTHDLEAGDVIDFLDFGSITGSFSSVNLPALGGGLAWDDSNLLIDGTLAVITGGIPGDTDGDGDVDDADLGTAFANYTGPLGVGVGNKTVADGDTDGDGDVDDADLGAAFAAYTGPLAAAAVPEPTSFALVGLGGLALIRRRRAALV
jgi:autotransporter-associated beta strand protein